MWADLFGSTAFGGFDGDDGPATLGAGLISGFVPDGVVTIGVACARVEDFSTTRFALHDGATVTFWAGDAGIDRFF